MFTELSGYTKYRLVDNVHWKNALRLSYVKKGLSEHVICGFISFSAKSELTGPRQSATKFQTH